MTGKRILSVGQCGPDHGAIARAFQQSFGAEVVGVDTSLEAVEKLRSEPFALVLVNRVYDADGSSGLEFIKQVKSDEALRDTPVMLVSNYEDAQQEAVAAGAVRGFGKVTLRSLQTVESIKLVLG
jgi:two-component system chemotaxis response regulator CheY